MATRRRQFGPLHIGFLAATAAAGWTTLVAVTIATPVFLRSVEVTWELLVCLGLAATSRFLAFRVFRRVRIALDSAFYVTAAFLFGVVPAAWVVLTVLTVDAAVRFARNLGQVARQESPWWYATLQVTHEGALPALVLLLVGAAFGVDTRHPMSDAAVGWMTPLFAVCFLVVHYFFVGGAHWVQGTAPRVLWRGFFLRVVAAELALVPLALAMVLGYNHQGHGLFLLLGASCLMFNVIFRRAMVNKDKLHRRVQELATLNKVGRIIAGSLERRQLMANVARETLNLVRHSSRFMIGLVDDNSDFVVYELFDESGRNYKRLCASREEGLSGWVMANRMPLLLGDVQHQYGLYSRTDAYKDPSFHSWLGVPLEIYNEVMGVMSVQSEHRVAFTHNHLRVMSTIADQAAVALENARLYEFATIDGLTGLFVRRYFDQRLQEEWLRSARYGTAFSVGILDLDDFKNINDTYGHQAGDYALRAVAGILRNNMRSFEVAARYGGEEFAFILPRTGIEEARKVGERIRADLERMVITYAGARMQVTASVGLASYPDPECANVSDLVARADQALYQAKAEGKNLVVVSTPAATSRYRGRAVEGLWVPGGAI